MKKIANKGLEGLAILSITVLLFGCNSSANTHVEQFYFILFCSVCSSIATLIAFKWKSKAKLQNFNDKVKAYDQKVKQYIGRINELEEAGKQETKLIDKCKEEISELKRKLFFLKAENRTLHEDTNVEAIFILEQLKNGILIVDKITIQERKHLYHYFDLMFGDYAFRLDKNFKLTPNSMMLAILLKAKFSKQQLTVVFKCTGNSISKMRQRLKMQLNLNQDMSLDHFITSF